MENQILEDINFLKFFFAKRYYKYFFNNQFSWKSISDRIRYIISCILFFLEKLPSNFLSVILS